jgi:hypothetical protein
VESFYINELISTHQQTFADLRDRVVIEFVMKFNWSFLEGCVIFHFQMHLVNSFCYVREFSDQGIGNVEFIQFINETYYIGCIDQRDLQFIHLVVLMVHREEVAYQARVDSRLRSTWSVHVIVVT